jgi:hypothetical protein
MSVVLLGTAFLPAVRAQVTPTPAAKAPVVLRATCDAQGDVPLLRVQIVNTSDRKTSVVVGFTPANGQAHVVNSLDVIAIRLATGANEDYVYVNPKYALAKGAPWIVSLAPGATHDLELPLQDFISTLNYNLLEPAAAAGTRLVFESRAPARSATPVWTGKVETVLEACRL